MKAVRVLLISTYDLGRQPFGLASPAAWLRRAGAEVVCVDTSREPLTDEHVRQAALVALFLPMHTATRLSAPLIDRIRAVNPEATLAAYGLYAPLNSSWLRGRGVTHVLGPEAESELVALVSPRSPVTTPKPQVPEYLSSAMEETEGTETISHRDVERQRATKLDDLSVLGELCAETSSVGSIPSVPLNVHSQSRIPRLQFIQPDRSTLPPLRRYAALQMPDGTRRVAGSTEASRGCKHLCRHCPIVPVYGGIFRAIPIETVLADVRAQVGAGAEHISFGDPDFFNGPTHARRLVERLAAEFPGTTYDVTIKIEHLLKHADLLPLLRDTGCLFVTSAVESVDDEVLARLRKGHTRADFIEAVEMCRGVGVALSPTFVPFTPWTTAAGYTDLLDQLETLEIVDAVAPIQLAIRLLVTADSALLELSDLRNAVGPFDAESLMWPWRHGDPAVDALQRDVMAIVD
jgi:radical SAM superfamily enzyme YgiQ (UPF0313 family)